MDINKFSDLRLSSIVSNSNPKLKKDRPHANNIIRYECNCEEDAKVEGWDINNYDWLDSKAKCLMIDWVSSGKVGYPKD